MNTTRIKALAGITLALLVLAGPALGQTKTGTTVGQFLLIEPSARGAAMGNASVTAFEEVASAFYNPGALGHMEESGVQFSHSQWLADITYNYAVAAVKLGTIHTLMLTVTSLNSGEIDVRTVEMPLGTGERYTVNNLAVGLGYTRRVTDRFSAGIQVNYIQETIWNSSLNALGANVGVLYELPFRARIGASLSNFGTRGSYDGRDLRVRYDQDPERFGDNSSLPAALTTESFPLPIFFRVGLGMPISINQDNRLLITVDALQPSDNTSSLNFGGEYSFMDLLFLRAGYQNLYQEDSETGLTLGGGLQYAVSGIGFKFDYAWAEFNRIGDVQRFTFGLTF